MGKVPYVHSNYKRKKNDSYMTIDPRCVAGLVEALFGQERMFPILDVCAAEGSAIVKQMKKLGFPAYGIADAFSDSITPGYWIVTNPPYMRPLVDNIIKRQIERIHLGQALGFAALLRSNFDFAKSRRWMFSENIHYFGQIKLLFRPWWSDDKKAQPIHNFVWHIWTSQAKTAPPIVRYATGESVKA